MSDKSTPANLSVREQKMLSQAMQCLETELKIDTDKFAVLTGLAPGSAKNAWRALRKKLTGAPGTPKKGTTGVSSSSVSKKSPVVKKRGGRVMNAGSDDADDDEDDVPAQESPSKKTSEKTKSTKAKGKGKAVSKSIDSVERVVKRELQE
ncbi:hypothetical protein BDV97DRAFT_402021 [Delphinella strobiligena]|nr:hypothetical protein BDV97DRAFT_402021 [Delphinella strobiligena]